VKELAAVPNIPLAEAWLRVLRHLGPTGLKEFSRSGRRGEVEASSRDQDG
jgi:hypothetical protein